MLTRLRRRLTMLAAVLTGSVVVAVAAVSFLLCGRMYTAQRQAAFEAAVSDLASQWELDSALDWQRIQDSAARNSIRFYFAENGSALLLSGLATGLAWLCDAATALHGDSTYLLPIACCAFPLMMLFARLFHKEKLPAAAALGLVLAVAGMFGLLLNV